MYPDPSSIPIHAVGNSRRRKAQPAHAATPKPHLPSSPPVLQKRKDSRNTGLLEKKDEKMRERKMALQK
jgi:hypothetical protein